MPPLEKSLRNQLERTIKEARTISEAAAKAALDQLGVGEAKPYSHLTEEDRKIRIRLRAHGRQLGDVRDDKTETQEIDRLVEEVAYEHWHRMLFARFLAENNLLMYPDPVEPVPVSLEECEDISVDEGAKNGWELASRFAAEMLPEIFRKDSPVFLLTLPPEHQQRLEHQVANLPQEIFTASDALGWVYQFWQAKRKEEVNASEVKIGERELPAVTQLFTETYMVAFLLDNSLGAWWVAHISGLHDGIEYKPGAKTKLQTATSEQEVRDFFALSGVPLSYLRFMKSPSPSGRGVRGEGKKLPMPSDILDNARELRKTQTDAEQLLWKLLRNRRFADKKFRRQHPIGRYILDFYCDDEKLAIELDGGQHNEEHAKSYDAERSRFLNEQGIHVLRFWNNDVLQKMDSVLAFLWNEVHKSPSPQTPLPEGEGLIWTPVAGTFDGWPIHLSKLKTLDPCCGSGHFIVAVFRMLVAMRMELEGLSARGAVDAVLRENIHGLEIDKRCVEIAAFALALEAWRYPGSGGYRPLPKLNVACSGLSVSITRSELVKLANGDVQLRTALTGLHKEFENAPVLGSLIDPVRSVAAKSIQWDGLANAVEKALQKDRADEEHEAGVTAQGLAKAAQILAGKYHWIVTNVPYLARGKQCETLRYFCEKNYPEAKNDLATVFLDRCLELCTTPSPGFQPLSPKRRGNILLPLPPGEGRGEGQGTVSLVLPQNWLFLTSYRKFREKLLKNDTWHLIARLGPGAFETISGEVVKAILITLSRGNALTPTLSQREREPSLLPPGEGARRADEGHIRGIDVSEFRTAAGKSTQLLIAEIKSVEQGKQIENPDAVVVFQTIENTKLLSKITTINYGSKPGQTDRVVHYFWELNSLISNWQLLESTPSGQGLYTGKEKICLSLQEIEHQEIKEFGVRSADVWGKAGIIQSQMREMPFSVYIGFIFDNNTSVLHVTENKNLPPLFCFIESGNYLSEIRKLNQKLDVAAHTMVKVPFDLGHWTLVAAEKYPNGLPKPYSNDPTQWIFHGHPCGSVIWDEKKKWTTHGPLRTDDTVLQAAVARLLGYRWPAELDTNMELANEQREWVKRCEVFSLTPTLSRREREPLVDDDGIVCIPPVRGEQCAADRLINLLAAAYNQLPSPSGRGAGGEGTDGRWSNDTLAQLLKNTDHAGKTLETWLREKFFIQHCKLFHHRPFIWHIWDGLRDGFAALVNYHKLDYKKLETLIYTYLGDWINRQKQDIGRGVDGAEEKLAAAEALKKNLELILEGEKPHDIFVRWKPIEKQPIGWNPDLNDGVRLNIRPFLSVPDVDKKGAGILRDKPNIKWEKDRGKDVASAPWYHLFKGDRINNHHLTLEEKQASRQYPL